MPKVSFDERRNLDVLLLYASTYLLVDVFCIIMAVITIRRIGNSFGSEREIRYFKHMIGFYLLFCLTDALWLPVNSGIVAQGEVANMLLSTINMVSMALVAYFWLCYALVKMGVNDLSTTSARVAAATPLTVLVFLCVANPFTGWMFSTGANGEFVRGPLYAFSAVFLLGYVLCVALWAVLAMHAEESRARRHEYLAFVQFGIMPFVACLFDVVCPNTPVIALGALSSIMFVFFSLQDARIYNDALTGLNNRRRADLFLANRIHAASENRPVCVYLLDVNMFKEINDTKGHAEGDHALQVIADGLRAAAGKTKGFVARWGGDEFILIADASSEQDPEEVVKCIDECIASACENSGLGYRISVTTGFAKCTSDKENQDELFRHADRMLYDRKQLAHA